jgi:hypothetical protein
MIHLTFLVIGIGAPLHGVWPFIGQQTHILNNGIAFAFLAAVGVGMKRGKDWPGKRPEKRF